jgi:hypothetical protein
MCNHLNLKILIRIFTISYLIMIIIILRGWKFRGTPRWPQRHTGVPQNTGCASLVSSILLHEAFVCEVQLYFETQFDGHQPFGKFSLRFEVLTTVNMSMLSWVVTPTSSFWILPYIGNYGSWILSPFMRMVGYIPKLVSSVWSEVSSYSFRKYCGKNERWSNRRLELHNL